MKRIVWKRILALCLVLVMGTTLIPFPALAATPGNEIVQTTQNSNPEDGVNLKKTASYDPDTGKMTITLEAYTTGVVTSHTTVVPTDIVLVLDVSGSMADPFSNGKSRMTAMKEAVNAFIDATMAQNATVSSSADMHSIAIVKFATNGYYNNSNKLQPGDHKNRSGYNYTEVLSSFTPVNASGAASLKSAVNDLDAGGATAVDYGLELASTLLTARGKESSGAYKDREQVVIVFTDGDPTHGSSYDTKVAYHAVGQAENLKANGAKLFSVGIFAGANPSDLTGRSNTFMNYISSNYPKAYGYTGGQGYRTTYYLAAGDGPYGSGYYKSAKDSASLTNLFQSISSEVGYPTVSLGSTATLIDVVSDYFAIDEPISGTPDITVQTADYRGGGTWAVPQAASGVTAMLDEDDGDTIYITGFDYDANYVSENARDGFYGRKVIVTIVTTPDYAVIDSAGGSMDTVPTNDSASLMNSEALTAAYAPDPSLPTRTVTYQVVEDGATRTVATYKRFPNAEVEVQPKHADNATYSYGDWTTGDVSITAGKFAMPSRDVTLTATATTKEYTVSFAYLGGVPNHTDPETAPASQKFKVGQPVTLPTVTCPDGYHFSGWEEDDLDITQGTTSFKMPAQNLSFEGWFIAEGSQYTVEHYLMDTNGEYPAKASHSTTYSVGVTTGQEVTAAKAEHLGFAYDETRTSQGQTMKLVGGDNLPCGTVNAAGTLVLKMYFKRNQYPVTYEYEGTLPTTTITPAPISGTDKTIPAYTESYYFGETVTVKPDAAAAGYTFSGWTIRTGSTVITDGTLIMPDAPLVLRGSFTASSTTPYRVEHWFEDLNGTYAEDPTKTQYLTGTTNNIVTGTPLADLIGFDYNAEKSAGTVSGKIVGGGTLVLKLYYSRTEKEVRYQYTGTLPTGVTISALPAPALYKYGKSVTVAPNAVAEGYTFTGWHSEQMPGYDAGDTFAMPEKAVVFTGGFEPAANHYQVEHYLMNTDGTYPSTTSDVLYYDHVKTGDTVTANTAVEHPGFYFDSGNTKNVLEATVAPDGSTVLKLYFARSKHEVSYQYINTPTGATKLPATAEWYYGASVPVAANATAPGYTFTGWSIYTGDTSISGGSMTMPDHDVVLHGAFNANTDTPYTVEHYLEQLEGGYQLYEAETCYGVTNAAVVAEPLTGTEVLGFTFDATIDGTVRTGTIAADGSLVLKLFYDRVEHDVTYLFTGTVPNGAANLLPGKKENVMYGTEVTVAGNPVLQGYLFSGWQSGQVPGVGANGAFRMGTEDVTFTGYFSPAPNQYKVEHYYMKTDGNYPSEPSEVNVYLNAVTGASVTATPVTPEGFTWVSGEGQASGTVVADGTTVLKLYYARNTYSVTYQYDGAAPAGAPAVPDGNPTVRYGAKILVAPNPELSGYTFSGWTIHTGNATIEDGYLTMPAQNVILHGSFVANGETPYTVRHYLQNLSGGDSYTLYRELTGKGQTDTAATAVPLAAADMTGFSYNSEKSTATGTIAGDGSLVLSLYYDRTKHNVTYKYTGTVPTGASAVPTGETAVMYGTEVTVEPNATATGYIFSGWSSAQVPGIGAGGTFTMGTTDVAFTGHFSPAPNQYKVEHYYMKTDGTYPTTASESNVHLNAKTGDTVTATPVVPEGFEQVAHEKQKLSGSVEEDGSTVLRLYYARKAFSVSYSYDNTVSGASLLPSTQTGILYGAKVAVAADATAPGYTFSGWKVHTGNAAIEGGYLTMPAQDVVLHGSFTQRSDTGYTVEHYFKDLNKNTYTLDAGKIQHFAGKTEATAYAVPLSGDNIIGFSYNAAKSTASGTIAGDGSLVLRLYYDRTIHSVKYQYTGQAPAGAAAQLPAMKSYEYGDTVTLAAAAAVTGYTFSGWYEHEVTPDSHGTFVMPARDVIFSGHFDPKTNQYAIKHYLMDTEGNYPESLSHDHVYKNVKTGDPVQAQTDVVHPGFTFVEGHPENVISGTVAGDGSTVLKLYFKRNQYTVSYDYTEDVTGQSALPGEKKYYYEEIVPVAPDATATGYTFTGWTVYSGDTKIENRQMKMPNHDVVIHGTFNPNSDTKYTVKHYFENLGDVGYTLDETKTQTLYGKTDEPVTAMPLSDASMLGFTYDSTDTGTKNTGIIKSDGSLVLELYYKRVASTVKYQYTGIVPAGAGSAPTETPPIKKYGTGIEVKPAPTTPAGYTFHGWTTDDVTLDANGGFSMPAHPVIFTGYFTANPSQYTVKHYLEDADGQHTILAADETFYVGVHVNQTVTGVAKNYTAYTYNPDLTKDHNTHMSTNTVPSVPTGTVNAEGDLVLKLYYDRKEYKITYQFEGVMPTGAALPTAETHKHGKTVDLAVITPPPGYSFDGWYLDETKVNGRLVMPEHDVTLTGRFHPNPDTPYRVEYYLQNLENDDYTLQSESYDAYGTTGSYVVGPRHDYDGFTFNLTQSKWNGHIAGDGSLVLQLYYDRNTYQVTYYYYGQVPDGITITQGGTTLSLSGETARIHTETVKHGATVTVQPELETTDTTREFKGWFAPGMERASHYTTFPAGSVFTMPKRDVSLYGAFFNYTVLYDLAGGKLNDMEYVAAKQVSWDSANLLPTGTPHKNGYMFTGWKCEEVAVTNATSFGTLAGSFDKTTITLTAQYEPIYVPGGDPDDGDDDKEDKPGGSDKLNTVDHYSYIVGFRDGELKPYDGITRGQVATIFFRLLTDEAREEYWSQTNSYSDCGPDLWCNNAISTLSNMGIIDGYLDGTFRPNAKITRAQFAKIAVGFFETTTNQYEGYYSDVSGSAWYSEYVEAATRVGLIQGFEDGTYRPNVNITRAQACVIVNRALGRKPDADHMLPLDEMLTWPDNRPQDWFYADMLEATNSHGYKWLTVNGEEKAVEQWTEKLPQRDWTALEHSWSTAHSAPGGDVATGD